MSRSKRISVTPEIIEKVSRAVTDEVTELRFHHLRDISYDFGTNHDNYLRDMGDEIVGKIISILYGEL